MNGLKILTIILGAALAVTAAGSVYLFNTNLVVANDRDVYASALEDVSANYDTVVTERDNLKTTVNTLVTERDTARRNEETLQGQVNQLTSDNNALTYERDSLKAEVNALVYERDAAKAEADKVRFRWFVLDHYEHNDGSRITFSGRCINTGVETLQDMKFHVTGYDMIGQLVIDLYVGEMDVYSGYSTNYQETVEYAPLKLSEWDVELIYEQETEE